MSYQVLARKWRPREFDTMVGQEHVLKALINALNSERLHHAYLFTGTRGVGKTTIARILAKCLNCETGISASPCGQCSACQEIDQGRFIDLIEVDAASRTKVDDTRELLENVPYAPTQGRYKVYLIDEVHMFSKHSFNALLKTLEEPPEHVKFLLATTDPQKLPITILSRCLQFNLKRLPPAYINGHLKNVLDAEAVNYDEAALSLLARSADGSMRDALSLLDQAIAYGEGQVQVAGVESMLGRVSETRLLALLESVTSGQVATVMSQVAALDEFAPDYEHVLQEVLGLLHRLAMIQALPDAAFDDVVDIDRLKHLAAALLPEDVQLFYQIGLHGRRDFPLAPDARQAMEMLLLRMLAFRPLGAEEALPLRERPVVSLSGQATPTETAAEEKKTVAAAPEAVVDVPQPTAVVDVPPAEGAEPEPTEASVVELAQTPTVAAVEVPQSEAPTHAPVTPPTVEVAPSVSELPEATPVAAAHDVSMTEALDDVPPWLDEAPPMGSLPPQAEHVAEPAVAEMSAPPPSFESTMPEPELTVQPEPLDVVAPVAETAPVPAVETPEAIPAEPIAPDVETEAAESAPAYTLDAANWTRIVAALDLAGLGAQLAANSVFKGERDGEITLHIEEVHMALNHDRYRDRLREALVRYLGRSVRLSVVVGELGAETLSQEKQRIEREHLQYARECFVAHPMVKALQSDFGATIEEKSIRPLAAS